jgi:hypothetical protein
MKMGGWPDALTPHIVWLRRKDSSKTGRHEIRRNNSHNLKTRRLLYNIVSSILGLAEALKSWPYGIRSLTSARFRTQQFSVN